MQPGQTIATTYEHRLSGLRIAGLRAIFGIDLRTLALFRLGLGLLLIVDLALRARDLAAHYTDIGILPRDVAVSVLSPGAFSLHLLNGTVWFQAALFVAAGLFAVMLMVGFRTRLATIASWVLLLSLQNRNPYILSGDDNLLMLLTFWAMFLPLGARYSVDMALDRRTRELPNAWFSVATLALLVQGMSVYFFSALLKSDPQWIPDGTAVYYALQLDYLVTPFGQTLDRSAVVADVCNFEFLSLSQELQVTLDSNGDAIVTMIAIAVHTTRKVTRELRTTRVWSWRDGRWLARLGQQSSRPGTPPNVESAAGAPTPGGPDGPACGWR